MALQTRAETQFQTIKGVVPAKHSRFCLSGHDPMLVHLDKVGVVISVAKVTRGNHCTFTCGSHLLFLSPDFGFPCGKSIIH